MTARPAPRLPHKSAADISAELRNSFVESLYRVTGSQAGPDPVLTAMFESLAVQFDRIYQEADQVFFGAALDDLIRGLGMPARLARPAQAVVQFSQLSARETVSPEIELVGYQVRPREALDAPTAKRVQDTIDDLGLNNSGCRQARERYGTLYLAHDLSFDLLTSWAPFVALELRRQGRLHPTDR